MMFKKQKMDVAGIIKELNFYFSNAPIPKRAKSYLMGSIGSKVRRREVTSSTAFQSFCFRSNNPSPRATFPEWTSRGSIRAEDGMSFHRPKSTSLLSFRIIQRRNILRRLAEELAVTSDTCFLILLAWGIDRKTFLKCFNAP